MHSFQLNILWHVQGRSLSILASNIHLQEPRSLSTCIHCMMSIGKWQALISQDLIPINVGHRICLEPTLNIIMSKCE